MKTDQEISEFNQQTLNPSKVWVIVTGEFTASGCFVAFPHKEWAEKYAKENYETEGLRCYGKEYKIFEYVKK